MASWLSDADKRKAAKAESLGKLRASLEAFAVQNGGAASSLTRSPQASEADSAAEATSCSSPVTAVSSYGLTKAGNAGVKDGPSSKAAGASSFELPRRRAFIVWWPQEEPARVSRPAQQAWSDSLDARIERLQSPGAQERQKRIDVPCAVARSFGKKERSFVSEQELKNCLAQLTHEQCWRRLVDILGRRDKTPRELQQQLGSEGFPKEEINKALEHAASYHLIDAQRYSETFVHSKQRRGWGKERIRRELEARGLDSSDISSALRATGTGPEDELNRARAALSKKQTPAQNAQQKFMRFLIYRGFSTGIARQAVQERLDADSADSVDSMDSIGRLED